MGWSSLSNLVIFMWWLVAICLLCCLSSLLACGILGFPQNMSGFEGVVLFVAVSLSSRHFVRWLDLLKTVKLRQQSFVSLLEQMYFQLWTLPHAAGDVASKVDGAFHSDCSWQLGAQSSHTSSLSKGFHPMSTLLLVMPQQSPLSYESVTNSSSPFYLAYAHRDTRLGSDGPKGKGYGLSRFPLDPSGFRLDHQSWLGELVGKDGLRYGRFGHLDMVLALVLFRLRAGRSGTRLGVSVWNGCLPEPRLE
ncbi:hypothetical protein F2Q69_00012452 [Brassica cretica]|uniref:Uncharacterized protein n=1 Tax=Brassica cretica TaxID=69181 RepID=A0A8S9R8X0_BRACR|nr:hypothetical protein F2Q69_00012452 [Brassica cretica]